jgi:polyisoprenoid-binding protein YceI
MGASIEAAPVDYVLVPSHSFVHFEWPHAGLSTLRGRFDRLSGGVEIDREARRGSARVVLRLDSVNTGRPALDAAVRHALGADGEASARVDIDSLGFDGDRPASARARFTWRAQTLELALHAEHFNCYLNPLLRREVCGGEFVATVEPAALGLSLEPSFALGRPIRLRIQVEAVRQVPGS